MNSGHQITQYSAHGPLTVSMQLTEEGKKKKKKHVACGCFAVGKNALDLCAELWVQHCIKPMITGSLSLVF
jgi:hypothetical protein